MVCILTFLQNQPKMSNADMATLVFTKNEKIITVEKKTYEIKIGESEYQKKERDRKEEEEKQKELKELEEIQKQKERLYKKTQIVKQTVEQNGKGIYSPGYCTWYVANNKEVPAGWGDAKNWYSNAEKDGYEVGYEPRKGAIIVTRESRWGHTGIVEGVDGKMVTISEMNFVGRYIVSERTVDINSIPLVGFIY
jgi:surface antigen